MTRYWLIQQIFECSLYCWHQKVMKKNKADKYSCPLIVYIIAGEQIKNSAHLN